MANPTGINQYTKSSGRGNTVQTGKRMAGLNKNFAQHSLSKKGSVYRNTLAGQKKAVRSSQRKQGFTVHGSNVFRKK